MMRLLAVPVSLAVFAMAACSTAPAAPTSAYAPAFHPQDWRGGIAGETTKVAVLASSHLSALSDTLNPDDLSLLLTRLEDFAPDIITHEGLSGEQCETLRLNPAIYGDTFDNYCWSLDEAKAATGLDQPAARAEAERLLADWPDEPSAAQRRRLAALFVASGDRASAAVQWLQLSPDERRTGDGVDTWMLKVLSRSHGKLNESIDVAAALAARLGHERVYAVDDHTSDSVQFGYADAYGPAIQEMWRSIPDGGGPIISAISEKESALTDPEAVVAYYRMLNAPEAQMAFIENDFGRAMTLPPPELYGRKYVTWYETRNLRMVANIRAAMANHPGGRVLNVVGASHKAYYETYLDQMSDVELVDMNALLGE